MSQVNKKPQYIFTHEGAKAKQITPLLQLKRAVMATLLWERQFYEDGEDIAQRISSIVPKLSAEEVACVAVEAREKMKLRHVPLLLVREMARNKHQRHVVAKTLAKVIQRADELTEFLALYWAEGKTPLCAQVKKGLAAAFTKFSAYQLAKYNRDKAIKLRDVLFLCHAKPKDLGQKLDWEKLISGDLPAPDTWEVALSAVHNKKETWERLILENKLGGLAFLRNLRNMQKENVDEQVIAKGLLGINTQRILPYRFIAAARHAPQWENWLEDSMIKCLDGKEKILGKTIILVDVSSSMDVELSSKSDLLRADAAAGLAILAREIYKDVQIYTFSNSLVHVPPRRGFALRDAIHNSQLHHGTYLGQALQTLYAKAPHERLIIITDEQSQDRVPDPVKNGYIINVASYENGVGYGRWVHIDGFSEAVLDYINSFEQEFLQ